MYHVCEFDYFFFKEKNQCIKCFTVYVPLINFKKKKFYFHRFYLAIDYEMNSIQMYGVCVCVCVDGVFVFILAVFSVCVCVCKILCGALNETKQKKKFVQSFFFIDYHII